MNISFHGATAIPQKKDHKVNAATKGAIFTAGVLGTTTAMSWATQPKTMKAVVDKFGGKGKYAANYAVWLAIYTAAGAAINSALSALTKIVKPNNPPKAN